MIARALREIALLLGLALVPAFVSGAIQLQPNRSDRAAEITPAEVLASRQEIVWIDARTPGEYAAGHAAGAILLNPEEWDRLIPPVLDAWHPDKLVVVYADDVSRSEAVARRVREELQVKNVRALKGGWQRWQEK